MTDAPRITDLELAAMESRARLVGSANCWTGTGGSVAADAFRLIAEVRLLRSERDAANGRLPVPPLESRHYALRRRR